jgi:hypothetical protein
MGDFTTSTTRSFAAMRAARAGKPVDHSITGNAEGWVATELLNQGKMLVNEEVKILNGYMSYLKRAHRTRATTDNE